MSIPQEVKGILMYPTANGNLAEGQPAVALYRGQKDGQGAFVMVVDGEGVWLDAAQGLEFAKTAAVIGIAAAMATIARGDKPDKITGPDEETPAGVTP